MHPRRPDRGRPTLDTPGPTCFDGWSPGGKITRVTAPRGCSEDSLCWDVAQVARAGVDARPDPRLPASRTVCPTGRELGIFPRDPAVRSAHTRSYYTSPGRTPPSANPTSGETSRDLLQRSFETHAPLLSVVDAPPPPVEPSIMKGAETVTLHCAQEPIADQLPSSVATDDSPWTTEARAASHVVVGFSAPSAALQRPPACSGDHRHRVGEDSGKP